MLESQMLARSMALTRSPATSLADSGTTRRARSSAGTRPARPIGAVEVLEFIKFGSRDMRAPSAEKLPCLKNYWKTESKSVAGRDAFCRRWNQKSWLPRGWSEEDNSYAGESCTGGYPSS